MPSKFFRHAAALNPPPQQREGPEPRPFDVTDFALDELHSMMRYALEHATAKEVASIRKAIGRTVIIHLDGPSTIDVDASVTISLWLNQPQALEIMAHPLPVSDDYAAAVVHLFDDIPEAVILTSKPGYQPPEQRTSGEDEQSIRGFGVVEVDGSPGAEISFAS